MTRQHMRPVSPILHNQAEYFRMEALMNIRKRGARYQYAAKNDRHGSDHNQLIPEVYTTETCRDLIVVNDNKA